MHKFARYSALSSEEDDVTEVDEGTTRYTTPRPFRKELSIIPKIRAHVDDKGFMGGVAAAFAEANVNVSVHGDTSPWSNSSQGVIFVGDHRLGVEYAPLLAMFGQVDREDVHFVAKPFSMQARIMAALGAHHSATVPVIPRALASDREDKFNRDLYWRIVNKGNLPTTAEIKVLNATSIQSCADLSTSGRGVVLYPAGGVMDAVKKPWQQGLGRVIKLLPAEAQERVVIVPFRFDDFSKLQLFRALHSSRSRRPQEIRMRIGRQGSVRSLLGDETTIGAMSAGDITEVVRSQFVSFFGQ